MMVIRPKICYYFFDNIFIFTIWYDMNTMPYKYDQYNTLISYFINPQRKIYFPFFLKLYQGVKISIPPLSASFWDDHYCGKSLMFIFLFWNLYIGLIDFFSVFIFSILNFSTWLFMLLYIFVLVILIYLWSLLI